MRRTWRRDGEPGEQAARKVRSRPKVQVTKIGEFYRKKQWRCTIQSLGWGKFRVGTEYASHIQ